MRVAVAFLVAAALSACAGRASLTDFRPLSAGEYQYVASVGEHNVWTEEDRMGWLDEWMVMNRACRNGYTVSEPQKVVVHEDFIETDWKYYYTVKCKP